MLSFSLISAAVLMHSAKAFGPLQSHVCAISTELNSDHISLDGRPRFRALGKHNAPAWLKALPESEEKQLFYRSSLINEGKSVVVSAEEHHLEHAHAGNVLMFYLIDFDESAISATLWGSLSAPNTSAMREVKLYFDLKERIMSYKPDHRSATFCDGRAFMKHV
jgi:hypothetical protein